MFIATRDAMARLGVLPKPTPLETLWLNGRDSTDLKVLIPHQLNKELNPTLRSLVQIAKSSVRVSNQSSLGSLSWSICLR